MECEGFLWEVEGLRLVGRAQFEANLIGGAKATWEQIVSRYPDDVEANTVLSTVLSAGEPEGAESPTRQAPRTRARAAQVETPSRRAGRAGRGIRGIR